MAEQALPMCGVCRRPPRAGEQCTPIRIQPGEITNKDGSQVEPGLYAACPECVETHRLVIAAALKIEPAAVSRQMMQ